MQITNLYLDIMYENTINMLNKYMIKYSHSNIYDQELISATARNKRINSIHIHFEKGLKYMVYI